tara:strand:- start:1475 stop:1723 length:249 start_codon:yes stop_codon:yes gene_type:complete
MDTGRNRQIHKFDTQTYLNNIPTKNETQEITFFLLFIRLLFSISLHSYAVLDDVVGDTVSDGSYIWHCKYTMVPQTVVWVYL